MKKSNSFLYKSRYNESKFESMKKVLHFPANEIKSNRLQNYFISDKFHKMAKKPKKSEYTLILSQKKKELNNISKISSNNSFMHYNNKFKNKSNILSYINRNKNNSIHKIKNTDSDWSSYKYNSKTGLNAPLSYKEFSNDSSEKEQNINNDNNQFLKKDLNKNNCNDNNQVLKKDNNNSEDLRFLKKDYTNYNINISDDNQNLKKDFNKNFMDNNRTKINKIMYINNNSSKENNDYII